jgi:iron(III) transport system permease protein
MTGGIVPAAVVVLPPLLWLAVAVLRALPSPGSPLLDPIARGLLWRSVLLGVLVTALAVGLGVPYGWAVARYRLPGRRLLMLASLLPLLLPPYAAALAWSLLLAREGAVNAALLRWGWIQAPIVPHGSLLLAVLVLGFACWPVTAWFTLFAARSVPLPLEDAARLHLHDSAAARWAVWPALRRSLPAAALLVFLMALADFGMPNSLGLPTYPVEIVTRFQVDRDPGVVARLALPLLLLVMPLVLLQSQWLARSPVGSGEEVRARLVKSPAGVTAGTIGCLALLAVSSLLPLGVLAGTSLPVSTYAAVWAESADHFLNTLVAAGGGAVLAVAAALLYGSVTSGARLPVLDLLFTLPYALPGSLIGVAMIQLLNGPPPREWLYGSLGGLVWTYAALFFPFAYKSVQPAWARIDRDLLDEGAVLGAGAWTQFRVAAWPVVRPYALAGGALVALLAAREVDATALLRIPGGDTIAFRIHDYLHFAPGPNVSALCVILVLLSAAVATGLALCSRPGG